MLKNCLLLVSNKAGGTRTAKLLQLVLCTLQAVRWHKHLEGRLSVGKSGTMVMRSISDGRN